MRPQFRNPREQVTRPYIQGVFVYIINILNESPL